MNDYEGSVAQQDVSISTEKVISSIVGKNFYSVLYVTNANLTKPTLVTKDTYEAQVDGLGIGGDPATFMKKNLAALFEYGEDVDCTIIKVTDLPNYKMKGYFVYLEPEYQIDQDTWKPKASMKTILDGLVGIDPDFTALFTDVPYIHTAVATEDKLTNLVKELVTGKPYDLSLFARGATDALDWKVNGDSGYSPCLYQIGRTLGYLNASGIPVGNSFDMAASKNTDVLPTRSIDIETISAANATVARQFEDLNVQYFKPIGNSTGNITSKGGWTVKGSCVVADWIVAYCNYVVRVACAEIITVMNTFRSAQTYNKILSAMTAKIDPFVQMGRLVGYKVTAPDFANLPKLGGSVLTIPNAWEATYVDNVREVKISGTLYVEG